MLALFRRNLFVNYIWLLVFCLVCLVYYILFPERLSMSDPGLPFGDVLNISLPYAESSFGQIVYALILIYLQTVLVANLVIKNRLSRQLSVIPGAVFCLYAFWSLHPVLYHNILLANLFFILSVGNLFDIYKRYKPISVLFNAGFFLGLAGIFYTPYVLFFIVCFFGLISLRSMNLKEFFQMFFGLLCPYFLLWVVLFYSNADGQFWSGVLPGFTLPVLSGMPVTEVIRLSVLFISMIGLVLLNSELLKKKTFDAIKKIELNYWFLFFGFVSVFLSELLFPQHLFILSVPVAVTAGLSFEARENTITKQFVFFLFVLYYFSMVLDVI